MPKLQKSIGTKNQDRPFWAGLFLLIMNSFKASHHAQQQPFLQQSHVFSLQHWATLQSHLQLFSLIIDSHYNI